jgi:anti-sigma factor RsiW
MTASETVSKAELHAFVDGQLDEARRREVAEYLGTHPDAAERVAAYQAQKTALRTLFNPVLEEPLPQALAARGPSRTRIHLFWAAASVALFIAGGIIGWRVQEVMQVNKVQEITVARRAAVAHAVFTPQRRHPVEVTADEETHLVRWLSKVLGAPLRAPRLGEFGFSLVGGRLLSAEVGPAAQFMYQDEERRRITLYVVTDARWRGTTEFRFAQEGPVSVFYWINGPVGYGLTAELSRPELLRIARAVYDELQPAPKTK